MRLRMDRRGGVSFISDIRQDDKAASAGHVSDAFCIRLVWTVSR